MQEGCKLPSPRLSRSSSSLSSSKKLQTERVVNFFELDQSNNGQLRDINKLLNRSRRVLVLTGAGISCNAGIPDFRSSNGLYNLVKEQYPEVTIRNGQEMFDISLFREESKISLFATFMEKLYSSVRLAKPTKTHRFIAHLKNRNKLLRCYTQNIDGLEESLGLEMSCIKDVQGSFTSTWKNFDVIQLHGDLNTLACTKCFHVFSWSRYWTRSLRRGELPTCPVCEQNNLNRLKMGKRDVGSIGVLRPNIVLYGENHPSCDFIAQGLNLDILKGKPDFLIIMGTSLKVDGVKKVVKQMSKQVHERGGIVLLVNKTSIADSAWHGIIDYQICCDCDTWVAYLEEQIPDFFKTQDQIDRLRQMKREASDLRKKQLEMKKLNQLEDLMNTPPATPMIKAHDDQQDSGIKNEFQSKSLDKIKKRLLQDNDDEFPHGKKTAKLEHSNA